MFTGSTRQILTYLFVILSISAALISLLLNNKLAKELSEDEQNRLEIWAMATENVTKKGERVDLDLILKILQSNTAIPVILYDEKSGELQSHNIALPQENVQEFLSAKREQFGNKRQPIRLGELNQLLYFDDSYRLKQLRTYPYIQLFVIALFMGLALFALNRSRRAEQNQLWVGLSKETAHQLGTPISSLTAWIAYLKLKEMDPQLLMEIEKDTSRLEMIAERFSKIGSAPNKQPSDLRDVIVGTLRYLEKRLSTKISFSLLLPDYPVIVSLNKPLFGWVIENLAKNAVDAMNGEGVVTFSVVEKGKHVLLDVSDTGKGVPKTKFKRIFFPGYTTKERGWGLGLSLVKRIVEVHHGWKINVLTSEPGKGTTFRIVLKKH
ncbi:MAG: HAMP domain-containing sensor histidine kinase [Proteiniphilum sp.]|nr:HAMP domain-containing sensor histidine kinase [Proteiniphilum sp.]